MTVSPDCSTHIKDLISYIPPGLSSHQSYSSAPQVRICQNFTNTHFPKKQPSGSTGQSEFPPLMYLPYRAMKDAEKKLNRHSDKKGQDKETVSRPFNHIYDRYPLNMPIPLINIRLHFYSPQDQQAPAKLHPSYTKNIKL